MPPDFTRLASSARNPSADDCDPARLVLPTKDVVDSTAPTHSAFRLPFQKLRAQAEGGDGQSPSSATIRLAHASGRIKEVTVKPGPRQLRTEYGHRGHSRRPSMSDSADVEDISITDITDFINSQLAVNGSVPATFVNADEDSLQLLPECNQDPRVCEAVLRAIYAPKVQDENLDDLMQDAETIRQSFLGLEASVLANAQSRAQKAAQYRRAEVLARLEKIHQDEDPFIHPASFDDLQHYESWKADETRELLKLSDLLATLPSFSASVQVEVISGDEFRPAHVSCQTKYGCAKAPQHLQVYCSVTVLPTKPGTMQSPDSESDDGASRTPAFLTDSVTCVDSAEWHAVSSWIPISSMQDRILIEVWDKMDVARIGGQQHTDLSLKKFSKSSFKQYVKKKSSKRSRSRRKVAPWSGDSFLGQVVFSFSHIEAQALAQGGVQGSGPVTNYALVDERGRQNTATLTLQFACICEHFYRDAPPDKSLLLPPVDDIERAYDILVRIAYTRRGEGEFQLKSQWKRIISNFACHYGVRKERCSLGIVHALAGMFNTDIHYLNYVVQEWHPVCLAAKDGRLTKSELAVHSSIVSLLIKPAVEVIENFQTVFPKNQPPGALSKLVELLSLILRWDLNFSEIAVPLRCWIQSFCEKRFRKYLVNDSVYSGELREISAQSIVKAVRFMRNDILEHGSTFMDAFPEACSLPSVTAPVYYKLVSSYVKSFVGAASVKTFPKEYVDLAKELLLLHEDIERLGVHLEILDMHSLFEEHLMQWLATMKPRMVDWISSSVSTEKWEPLSPQTRAFFSFSIVDLFFMVGEVVDEVTSRLLSLPFGDKYLQKVEIAICTAIETYVGVLEKLCLEDLPEELSNDSRGILSLYLSTEASPSLSLSKSLCVKLNDIQAVLEQGMDLEKRLESMWGTSLQSPSLHSKTESDPELDFPELDEPANGEDDPKDKTALIFVAVNRYLHPSDRIGQKLRDMHHYVQQTLVNVTGSIVENMQSRLASELQYVLRDLDSHAQDSLEEQFRPLTQYMDEHLSVMNDWLHPTIFRRILREIAQSLLFCMEEFALNRDEDPNPMTAGQRRKLGESLTFFYDYFYGGGLGLSSTEMDEATNRLRKILASWDLDTNKVCSLYWQAWDKYNYQVDAQENNSLSAKQTMTRTSLSNGDTQIHSAEAELNVLDYLWLLRQKDDEEAQDIVMHQSLIANNKMMQFIFGLPRDEEMVDSFSCRNSRKCQGTLYITPRHVCFAHASMAIDDKNLFIVQLDRVLRVDVVGSNTISIVPLNKRPTKFTKISDCGTFCRVLFKQIVGSGTHLEKHMANTWAKEEDLSTVQQHAFIRSYQCFKHRILSKHRGTLKVSAAHLIFEENDNKKNLQIEHGSIQSIHAGRKGLRASGVVVELKSGNNLEFVDFSDANLSPENVAKELNKVVFGGTVKSLSEKKQLDGRHA